MIGVAHKAQQDFPRIALHLLRIALKFPQNVLARPWIKRPGVNCFPQDRRAVAISAGMCPAASTRRLI
jgi:hypothetical protein